LRGNYHSNFGFQGLDYSGISADPRTFTSTTGNEWIVNETAAGERPQHTDAEITPPNKLSRSSLYTICYSQG
jgi:hypothetical protein